MSNLPSHNYRLSKFLSLSNLYLELSISTTSICFLFKTPRRHALEGSKPLVSGQPCQNNLLSNDYEHSESKVFFYIQKPLRGAETFLSLFTNLFNISLYAYVPIHRTCCALHELWHSR